MQWPIVDILSIVVACLMTGAELTVAVFLHPTLSRLPDAVHTSAVRAFARVFGRAMPFWYALTFLLSLVEVWLHWPIASGSSKLLLTASILWLLTIVFTLIFPVPINNRIAGWKLEALPANWREERRRWDRLHAIRVVVLLIALVSMVSGILAA
jgi:uncharacterized membrane protein